jgi:septum formation protein
LLASASPRRRQLLEEAGVAFEVVVVQVTELGAESLAQFTPSALAQENARLKAKAAVTPGRWVLGADTVVTLGDQIFGKPASLDEARDYLRALGGRVHEVISGCALIGPDGEERIFHDVTRVTFLPLSEETIARYLAAVPVLDKAGGYALQDKGEWLVETVHGSSSNVVGLPMERLLPILRAKGLA